MKELIGQALIFLVIVAIVAACVWCAAPTKEEQAVQAACVERCKPYLFVHTDESGCVCNTQRVIR